MKRTEGIPAEVPGGFRLVAKTQSIDEADRIAEEYRLQGFMVKIEKQSVGGIALFLVWAGKDPDIIS